MLNCFWGAPCLLISLQTPGSDEIQQLQKTLLDYLDENIETDSSLVVSVSVSYTRLCIYRNQYGHI